MNRLLAGIGIAAMVFAPVGIVMACSRHGTNAGVELNEWIQDNMEGTGMGAIGAFGGQDLEDGSNRGRNGWAAHDVYWVDITLPDGSSITESGTPSYGSSYGDHDLARFADEEGGGGDVEVWLVSRGKEMIRDWFEDYEPADIKLKDFAG